MSTRKGTYLKIYRDCTPKKLYTFLGIYIRVLMLYALQEKRVKRHPQYTRCTGVTLKALRKKKHRYYFTLLPTIFFVLARFLRTVYDLQ